MSRLPIRTIQPAGQPDAIGALGQGLMSVAGAVHQRDMALQRAEEQVENAQRARDALNFDEETAILGGEFRSELSRMSDPDEIASRTEEFIGNLRSRTQSIGDANLRDHVQKRASKEVIDTRVLATTQRAQAISSAALADSERYGDTLEAGISAGRINPFEAIEDYEGSIESLVADGATSVLQGQQALQSRKRQFIERYIDYRLHTGMVAEASAALQSEAVRAILTTPQLRTLDNQVQQAEHKKSREKLDEFVKAIFDNEIEGLNDQITQAVDGELITASEGLQMRSMLSSVNRQQAEAVEQGVSSAFYSLLGTNQWQAADATIGLFSDPKVQLDRRGDLNRVFDEYTKNVIAGNLVDLDGSLAGIASGYEQDIVAAEAGFDTYIARSQSLLDEAPSTLRGGLEREIKRSLGASLDSAIEAAAFAGQVETVSNLKRVADSDMLKNSDRTKLVLKAMDTAEKQRIALRTTGQVAFDAYTEFQQNNALDPNRVYSQALVNSIYERATLDGTQKDLLRAMRDLRGTPLPTAAVEDIRSAFINNDALTISEYFDLVGVDRLRVSGGGRGQNIISDGVLRLFAVGNPAIARNINARITNVGFIRPDHQDAIKKAWNALDPDGKMEALGIPSGAVMTLTQEAAMGEAYAIAQATGIEPSVVFGAMYEQVNAAFQINNPPSELFGLDTIAFRATEMAVNIFRSNPTYVPRNITATPEARASIQAATRLYQNAAFGDAVPLPDGGVAAPIYNETKAPIGFTFVNADGSVQTDLMANAQGDPRMKQAYERWLGRNEPEFAMQSPGYTDISATDNNGRGKTYLETHSSDRAAVERLWNYTVQKIRSRGIAISDEGEASELEMKLIMDEMDAEARRMKYRSFQ